MVGATLAPQVPWQVMVDLADSILDGGFAGGALISERWVLTAGRNLFVNKSRAERQGAEPLIPKVYLGIPHRDEANTSSEVAVEKVVLHPHFQNHSDWDNDLALIQLKDPVVMNESVTAIPLPLTAHYHDGTGVIAGWGFDAYQVPASSLKFLRLPLADRALCSGEPTNDSPHLDDNMICTIASVCGENVCLGDAGGALAINDTDTGDIFVAGILSYDKGCQGSRLAVYTKVLSYLPWIHSVMRGDTAESSFVRTLAMSKM